MYIVKAEAKQVEKIVDMLLSLIWIPHIGMSGQTPFAKK